MLKKATFFGSKTRHINALRVTSLAGNSYPYYQDKKKLVSLVLKKQKNGVDFMMLQIFYRAIIPFTVMSFISLILLLQEKNYQAKGTFITSLIILILGLSSFIYEINTLNLKQKTIVHFVLMLVTIYPILLLSGWFKLNVFLDYLKVFGIFIGFGVAFWIIFLLISKLTTK
mgnify:CR=1 FL=1